MRRAWPFFDIWILSRRPFWVARVERVRFARQPENLQNFIFGALWCGLVRSGTATSNQQPATHYLLLASSIEHPVSLLYPCMEKMPEFGPETVQFWMLYQ